MSFYVGVILATVVVTAKKRFFNVSKITYVEKAGWLYLDPET